MMRFLVACAVVGASAFTTENICSGCNEMTAIKYQKCAMEHGDPCAEVNDQGLVSSKPGTKKDVGCCMKKEKHEICMKCELKDCEHGTCNVNKQYSSPRVSTFNKGNEDADWDKKAMKESGWGF